jgi:pimeloyl-ACP methyl ester carboxylesterase
MDVARTEKSVLTPDGLTLWAQTFGSPLGQPVLLIMGAMNPGLLWPQAFCEHLARAGFFVIRYDHRDTGRSSVVDMASSPYTLTEMSADALAILDAYGVAEADLVVRIHPPAHSWRGAGSGAMRLMN